MGHGHGPPGRWAVATLRHSHCFPVRFSLTCYHGQNTKPLFPRYSVKPVSRAEGREILPREAYSARLKGVDAASQNDRKGKQTTDSFCLKQHRRPDSGADIKKLPRHKPRET